MIQKTLPALPPRLLSATIAAAEQLAAIARAEGIELIGGCGQSLPHLITMLFVIRERIFQGQIEAAPDSTITPGEVATVLETIAQVMDSEGMDELAGHNARWYRDAAGIMAVLSLTKGLS
jgi:hypothetical protein